jgi:hypothetical protein
VLTVTDLESALVDSADARLAVGRAETRRVFARVDEVIGTARLAWCRIDCVQLRWRRRDPDRCTRVVTRSDWEFATRPEVFWSSVVRDGIFGGSAANAFDIGGRHLMPLSKRHAFADLRQMAPPAAIDLVRQRATLPELHEYERESLVHRGTIVQRPMRMARR